MVTGESVRMKKERRGEERKRFNWCAFDTSAYQLQCNSHFTECTLSLSLPVCWWVSSRPVDCVISCPPHTFTRHRVILILQVLETVYIKRKRVHQGTVKRERGRRGRKERQVSSGCEGGEEIERSTSNKVAHDHIHRAWITWSAFSSFTLATGCTLHLWPHFFSSLPHHCNVKGREQQWNKGPYFASSLLLLLLVSGLFFLARRFSDEFNFYTNTQHCRCLQLN